MIANQLLTLSRGARVSLFLSFFSSCFSLCTSPAHTPWLTRRGKSEKAKEREREIQTNRQHSRVLHTKKGIEREKSAKREGKERKAVIIAADQYS